MFMFRRAPPKSPEYLAAERLFLPQELRSITDAFNTQLKSSGLSHLDEEHLLALLKVDKKSFDPNLLQRLFLAIKADQRGISLQNHIIALAHCTKGSPEDAADFTRQVLLGAEASADAQGAFKKGLTACVQWACDGASEACDAFVQDIISGLEHYRKGKEAFCSQDHFRRWAKAMPALVHTVQALMKGQQVQLPGMRLTSTATRTPTIKDCLMSRPLQWLISSWLPSAQTEVWELLFSSKLHGRSFNTFIGRVANKGPTVVLVKDKGGACFGAYAADAWSKHGTYYGSSLSFLFGVHPATARFPATGVNQNMLWCGQGFSQLPNGFGLGGQVGYFGLYVDSTFEKGMSRPCATFSNNCLASAEVFDLEAVECWLVQQPEEEEQPAGGDSSVLDKFKEDRHLMEMAGRTTQASAGIREARPEDDL